MMAITTRTSPSQKTLASPAQLGRPWLMRAVESQVTVPFQTFLNALLPKYTNDGIGEAINSLNRVEELSGFYVHDQTAQELGLLPDMASSLKVPKEPIHAFVCKGRVNHDAEKAQSENKWYLCAEVASKVMSAGLPRHHVFGVYIENDQATFLYYNHSLVIVSEPLNWVKDQQAFWNTIYTISYSGPEILGTVADFPTFSNRNLHVNGLDLELLDVIKASKEIIGECTAILHARIISGGKHKGDVVTVRFNFVVQGWYEENVIRQLYREANRRTKRSLVKTILEDAKIIKKKRWLRVKTIPEVICSQVYTPSSKMQEHIRRLLGDRYEPRELRATVYRGELYPASSLTDHFDIIKVFRDILKCQHQLFLRMKIVHRALTPDNILFYREGNNQIHGILIGFEYCAHVDVIDSLSSYLQCIEAMPFLSPDILEKYNSTARPLQEDLYRYEIESLYYVFIFLVTHYENGNPPPDIHTPYKAWFTDDYSKAAESKIKYNKQDPPTHLEPTGNLTRLKPLAEQLHCFLYEMYYLQRKRNKLCWILFEKNDVL